MEFYSNLCGCNPPQIVNFNYAFSNDDLESITVYDNCSNPYSQDDLEYAYSYDNVCWSCYMSYTDLLTSTINADSDFYLRIKVSGVVTKIEINCLTFTDYTTTLMSGFNFTYCSTSGSSNMYNPYANMENAIALQQLLVETVSCMFGIPIYYFKLSPNVGSRDITFKEYALMDVEAVKQIKLVITDGTMPSSKPEFNDWGLEWLTDWETEISKGMFATAFGSTALPTEGDLIYIPMMKRMWMVNEAYEEKNGNLMWNSTTFKVTLVKYQEKDSVDLGETEALVNTFVKNKYEDLFGEQENVDAQEDAVESPKMSIKNNMYPIYKSDSVRKYVDINYINFVSEKIYYKGTLISDESYGFNSNAININTDPKIIYQKEYCGTEGACSFIIKSEYGDCTSDFININGICLQIIQKMAKTTIKLLNTGNSIEISSNGIYFIYLIWSKKLNTIKLSASRYTWPTEIPRYRLQPHNYEFDINNEITSISKYNIEMQQESKGEIYISGFLGTITNFKLFDVYNDNVTELLQMYPTHQHLIINDTARKFVDLTGVKL